MASATAIGLLAAALTIALTGRSSDEPPTAAPAIDASTVLPFAAGFSGTRTMVFDPSGSPFDPSGSLVVLDRLGGEIVRVDIRRDGSAGDATVIGRYFDDLYGLALDDSGAVHFSNYGTVLRLLDQTEPVGYSEPPYVAQQWHRGRAQFEPSVVATNLATGLTEPHGVAIDRHGDLYVADRSPSGTRIMRINFFDDGTVAATSEVGIVPNDNERGVDIAFGTAGELFVLNNEGHIWQLTPPSEGLASARLFASVPGDHTSLAIDASGTPHVGTSDGTIYSIASDGRPTPVVTGFDRIDALEFDATGVLYVAVADEVVRLPVASSQT